MAKSTKNTITYCEKYKKNVLVDKNDVIADAKNSKEIHLRERGMRSDGKEFITVTIFV